MTGAGDWNLIGGGLKVMPKKSMSLLIALTMSISAIPMTNENSEQVGTSPSGTGGLADSPWPMFRHNLNHTGLSPYDTSGNNGQLKWSFTTGAYVYSPPSIGSDGTIYVGSYDNRLYAINPDGTEKWSYLTGSGVGSSPTIGFDGTIYVSSYDSKLYAIRPNGTEMWNFTTGMDVRSSPSIGSDGTIYMGSQDTKLYAINPDGSEKWNFTTGGPVGSSPAISYGGTIYVGSLDHKLYAINPDGTEKWSFTTGERVWSSPSIGSDETVYVGSYDDRLYAINPDGTEKWNFTTDDDVSSSPAIGSDCTIYVGSNDGRLYAINPDGTQKWNFTTGSWVLSSPAIGSDGTNYVGSGDNNLYAISRDGTEKWRFTTGDGIVSSPSIGSDGTVFIGSRDSKLHAIGMPLNQPLVADAGPDQTVYEGDTVFFNATVSQAEQCEVIPLGKNFRVNDVNITEWWGGWPRMVFDEKGTIYMTWTDGRAYGDYDIYFDKASRQCSFGQDIRVDDSPNGKWDELSDIAIGTDRKIHIGWGSHSGKIGYSTSNDDGETFSPAVDIRDWSKPAKRPVRMASGSDGSVHVVYGGVTYRRSPDGGKSWDRASRPGDGEWPDIALGQNHSVYVVWEGKGAVQGLSDIYFSRKNSSGSFEPPKRLHPQENWTHLSPSISIGPDGEIYTTWIEFDSGDDKDHRVVFVISEDGGSSFENPTVIRQFNPAKLKVRLDNVAIASFGTEGVAVAWIEIHDIHPQRGDVMLSTSVDEGRTFSPYSRVDDEDSRKRTVAIAGNVQGDLIAAWHDGRLNPPGILSGSEVWAVWLNVSSPPVLLEYGWDFDASVDLDGDGNYTNDKEANGPSPIHIYYDDGVYTVTLTATDSQGQSATDQCNVTVLNVPPIPEWTSRSSDGTILKPPYPEGKDILFEATVYDPGIFDTFTYDWDFGDGTILLDAGPSVTHAYGDNDTCIVVLKVTDDDGGTGIDDTPPLLTTNEDPVASISLPRCPFFEGIHACPITGSFADPGWLDTHSAVWDFGDGGYETAVITEENEQPDATGTNFTSHLYGDNGVYNITFTVVDDDGGSDTALAWASPYNLPPSITVDIPSSVKEGEHISLGITATDPGSDDLFIDIDWGDGTSESEVYFNNDIGPDPPNSGPGVFPFTIHANFSHVYGDNGNFTIAVKVEDDDGGVAFNETIIVVENVPPTIEHFDYFFDMTFSFRIAGEKWHNVEFHLFEDGTEIEYANITRYPGSPDDQMARLANVSIDFSKRYSAIAYYTPEDDPINGQIWGATPAWVIMSYDDGSEERIHHTFNVRHEETWIWIIDDFTSHFIGRNITFVAVASDPGSDDLIFKWDWGDGTSTEHVYYNDGVGPDPYPSPDVNPITVTDTVQYSYVSAGTYTITLTVTDDDGGSETFIITLTI